MRGQGRIRAAERDNHRGKKEGEKTTQEEI